MMRGSTPAVAAPSMRASGLRPCRCDRGLGGDQQGPGAVIDARGIARGHRAALAERRRQLGQRLERGVRARMLVAVDDQRFALAARDRDGRNFLASRPLRCAATARCCERSANASWSARLT